MFAADAFARANGSLGGNFHAVHTLVATGGIQLLNNAFAPSGAGVAIASLKGTFGNDQWALAQISAIAAFTSVVSITACTSSAGTSTYTYTLTSGSPLIVNQVVNISGMKNSGNDGGFQVSSLGAGTFSVLNGSPGANESGSTGTGNSPSDSACGLALRTTADGLNGYFLFIGTNSGTVGGAPTDGRVYQREIWKVVNGTLGFLVGTTPSTIVDSVGDVYMFTVVGTTLTVLKNGVSLLTASDTDLTSGSPGVSAFSVAGSGEWANPTDYTTGGNSGTQWGNFQCGDVSFAGTSTVASTNFPGSGDLVASDAHWSYIGSATATVGANHVTPTASGGAKYNATLTNFQWCSVKLVTVLNGTTTENQGPSICNQNTNDRYYVQTGTAAGLTPTVVSKSVSGTPTQLFAGSTPQFVNGDTAVLFIYNGILTLLQNGSPVVSIADTALTGGIAGYYADGAGGVMSTWAAGDIGSGGSANLIPALTGGASWAGVIGPVVP